MKGLTEKLAPVALSKKQKRHLEKKAKQNNLPITMIVRQLIDKDMEKPKRSVSRDD